MDKEAQEKMAEILYNTQRRSWTEASWYEIKDTKEARRYYDIADEAFGELFDLSYRKLPKDKPPLLSDEEMEEASSVSRYDKTSYREVAQAQREADVKHYEGK